jgi:large subunit ribosomal protein L5
MSLYTDFNSSGRANLQKTLAKENTHQVPVLDKVVVAMGIGSLATRKGVKDFSDLEHNLTTITGQAPQQLVAKKSVSNFKLREGMPVMLRTTLRGAKAYDFIERLAKFALPRVRDFNGLSARKFDGRGNYTLGLPNQVVFPEINPEDIKTPMGVQITMCTTADTDEDAQALLQQLGIIFEKKTA